MGVDEPNKLGRVAELVTIGGAFFNLVLIICTEEDGAAVESYTEPLV